VFLCFPWGVFFGWVGGWDKPTEANPEKTRKQRGTMFRRPRLPAYERKLIKKKPHIPADGLLRAIRWKARHKVSREWAGRSDGGGGAERGGPSAGATSGVRRGRGDSEEDAVKKGEEERVWTGGSVGGGPTGKLFGTPTGDDTVEGGERKGHQEPAKKGAWEKSPSGTEGKQQRGTAFQILQSGRQAEGTGRGAPSARSN